MFSPGGIIGCSTGSCCWLFIYFFHNKISLTLPSNAVIDLLLELSHLIELICGHFHLIITVMCELRNVSYESNKMLNVL